MGSCVCIKLIDHHPEFPLLPGYLLLLCPDPSTESNTFIIILSQYNLCISTCSNKNKDHCIHILTAVHAEGISRFLWVLQKPPGTSLYSKNQKAYGFFPSCTLSVVLPRFILYTSLILCVCSGLYEANVHPFHNR